MSMWRCIAAFARLFVRNLRMPRIWRSVRESTSAFRITNLFRNNGRHATTHRLSMQHLPFIYPCPRPRATVVEGSSPFESSRKQVPRVMLHCFKEKLYCYFQCSCFSFFTFPRLTPPRDSRARHRRRRSWKSRSADHRSCALSGRRRDASSTLPPSLGQAIHWMCECDYPICAMCTENL